MEFTPLHKSPERWSVVPNLLNYEETRSEFSWDAVGRELDGLPGGQGLNVAHEAVDRHANGPRRNHLAIRWLGKDGSVRDFTYGDLKELSNRFANVLVKLGAGKGDRVFVLCERIPELYIGALGTLKNTSIFCPLFSAFGPSRSSNDCKLATARYCSPRSGNTIVRLPSCAAICPNSSTCSWPTSRKT